MHVTRPSNLRFFSMRISAIDGSPAHWLERRSDLHPVRVPRLLILTEGVAPPGLNTLTNWYNRYKAVWLVVHLTCSITSDKSAVLVKASVIAQQEQKPCKRLTIITACHLPELKSFVEHRYYRLQDEKEVSFVRTMPKSLAASTCFMALSGQMFV